MEIEVVRYIGVEFRGCSGMDTNVGVGNNIYKYREMLFKDESG